MELKNCLIGKFERDFKLKPDKKLEKGYVFLFLVLNDIYLPPPI